MSEEVNVSESLNGKNSVKNSRKLSGSSTSISTSEKSSILGAQNKLGGARRSQTNLNNSGGGSLKKPNVLKVNHEEKLNVSKGSSSSGNSKNIKNNSGLSTVKIVGKNVNNNLASGSSSSTSNSLKKLGKNSNSILNTSAKLNSKSKIMTPSTNDMSQLVHEMDIDEDGTENIQKTHKSTLAHASFNYINSILGSGVIGMPYALHQAGVGLGVLLMFLVAWITDYSLRLMVRTGELSGSLTYQGMMETAFGRYGFYVLSILQLTYPLIAMISYNIIVGDTLTKVLGSLSLHGDGLIYQREGVVLAATLLVTLPLSLHRNVSRMSRVSFFSLLSIAFITVSIFIRLHTLDMPWTTNSWQFANSGVIQAIGVFGFAFMCHHNTFMIYSSMEESSESSWKKVTHISISTSLIVGLLVALGGYSTFTGNVQGDLLENYCWDDTLINVSRFLFCITILLTFPLECFVVRDVVENLFFSEKQPSSMSRHFSITLSIVLLAYIISMSTDCLGVVLELNGILAAMPLAYILPSLCFIRLDPSRLLSREKIPAILTATFGTVVSVVGLFLLIANGPSSGNCSHGQLMSYCTTNPNYNLTSSKINLSYNSSLVVPIIPHN